MKIKMYIIVLSVAILHAVNGQSKTIKASDYGFNKNNATFAFQKAMTSSYDTIIIDFQGTPWKVAPSWFTGLKNKTIIFEPGVVLQQKAGLYADKLAMLFRLERCENISIYGYGATFRMNKEELRQYGGEFRISMALYDCTNIKIKGLRVEESGGDGLIISSRTKEGFCKNIIVEDVSFINHFRQGMTIVSLEDGLFRNCIFEGTSGTPPEAGVDLEPDYSSHRLSNITFENCSFTNNGHAGILFALSKTDGSTPPIDMCFYDCYIAKNNKNKNIEERKKDHLAAEINIGMTKNPGNPLLGIIHFERTIIEEFPYMAFITMKTENAFRLSFDNLIVTNRAEESKGHKTPLNIGRYNYRNSNPPAGGIAFNNILIDTPYSDDFLSISGDRLFNWQVQNLSITGIVLSANETDGIKDLNGKLPEYSDIEKGINLEYEKVTNIPATKVEITSKEGRDSKDSPSKNLLIIKRVSENLNFPLAIGLVLSYKGITAKDTKVFKKIVFPSGKNRVTLNIYSIVGNFPQNTGQLKLSIVENESYQLGKNREVIIDSN